MRHRTTDRAQCAPDPTDHHCSAPATSCGGTRRNLRHAPGSQYLLYGNGVFGLRYDAFAHVYLGSYRQDYDTILFMFGGASTATGTLKEDLLEVRYSDIMVHSDFENAIYRRSY